MPKRQSKQQAAPWEQQAREPDIWYRRFLAYRDLGPERTLVGAYRVVKGSAASTSSRKNSTVPTSWIRMRDRWEWVERAQLWDREEYARLEQKVRKSLEQHYIDALDLAHQVNAAALRKALELIGMPAVYKAIEEVTAGGAKTVRAGVLPIDHYRGAHSMAEEAIKFIERLTGRRTDPDVMDALGQQRGVAAEPAIIETPLVLRDMEWLQELPAAGEGADNAPASDEAGGGGKDNVGNDVAKSDQQRP